MKTWVKCIPNTSVVLLECLISMHPVYSETEYVATTITYIP